MAIVAVMMVVGFSAFKLAETNTEEAPLKGCAAKFGNQGMIPFYFDPSVEPTEENVENPDNWIHGSHPSQDCDEDDKVACGLLVYPTFVDDTDPNELKLKSTINLTAEEQEDEEDPTYVKSIASGAGQIFNRSL